VTLRPDVARIFLALILLLTLACASAQQRHNYLAVDGDLVDAAGPYYFIEHGDSANAFARAAPLAEAMGLKVEYLADQRVLRFTDGFRTARFRATSDVAAGLVKAPGVVSVDPPVEGESTLASPMAILVDGVSYVPIAPLARAFEGESGWVGDRRLVTVDTATRFGYAIPRPRTGITDGVSRVAVDIPASAGYQVAADGSTLLLVFPGARLRAREPPHRRRQPHNPQRGQRQRHREPGGAHPPRARPRGARLPRGRGRQGRRAHRVRRLRARPGGRRRHGAGHRRRARRPGRRGPRGPHHRPRAAPGGRDRRRPRRPRPGRLLALR